VQVRRFGYTSGAEGVSGVAKIEAVKRVRVDSRLVGEFEFSFFQRSFDGARADYARRRARATAAVKLAVSVGGALERTVHIHAKKALKAGASPNALRQVALIALPTIGLPRAMDALTWIQESIEESTLADRDEMQVTRH
jgi:hypothetical protein